MRRFYTKAGMLIMFYCGAFYIANKMLTTPEVQNGTEVGLLLGAIVASLTLSTKHFFEDGDKTEHKKEDTDGTGKTV